MGQHGGGDQNTVSWIIMLFKIQAFWDVTPYRLVNSRRRFEERNAFETSVAFASRYGVTSQKILNQSKQKQYE